MLEEVVRGGDPRLTMHVEPCRDIVVLHAVGEVDLVTAAVLQAAVTDLWIAGFTAVQLDLTELDYLDCSGLRMLEREQRSATARGCRFDVLIGGGAVARLVALVGHDLDHVTRPPPVKRLPRDAPG